MLKLRNYLQEDDFFVVDYEEVNTIISNDDEELTLIKMVVEEIAKNEREILQPNNNVINRVQQGLSTVKAVDLIIYHLKIQENEKYEYLEEASLTNRLKMLLGDINRLKMIVDIERKINEDVKKSIDENQKEYYLREKMRAIQNELGDKVKREEEIEELRKAILEAKMPENIEEKALQELSRLRSTPSAMAESSI